MEHRNWNKNNIRTSLLGYGCMRFPTKADGTIDEERAEALLNTAKAAGVNYFDTAYPYHNGQSEPFVGRVIAKWDRSSFYLATKMPLWKCKSLDDAKRIFEEQLQRLGVDYIDFYLLHSLHKARYEKAKAMGLVDWLWQQKAAGRIRNFGFPAMTTLPDLSIFCATNRGISASCNTIIWTGTTVPRRSAVTGAIS